MVSRMDKQAKTGPVSPEVPCVSAKTGAHPRATGLPGGIGGICLHALVFLAAFLIVCSRRPDAVLNAQFFAEDGASWYADAYRFGLHSLLMTQSSYLHTLTRLIALFSLLFPFSSAPLVMNLCAITVQILPVNVFLSSRFSNLAFPIRLLSGFLYLALPNTYEIDANITTIQWHLALLACLLLLARPASDRGWRIFDGIVLILISLDGPMGIALVLIAAALWWKRRQKWQAATLALLVPGALTQGITVLLHLHERQPESFNGACFTTFAAILGRQVFFSSLLGLNTAQAVHAHRLHFIEEPAAALGLVVVLYVLLYALRHGPAELKLFILFASMVFAMALAHPLAGPVNYPQWALLRIPGCDNRYYFLPMLAFLASLVWVASRAASPRSLRYITVALLLLLPIGIYQDWRYPPFVDYHFQEYANRFERAPSGTKVTIPINPPGWAMELTKR
jgi:hypothetical protein